MNASGLRTPRLLQPVGAGRWGMAVALALALGAILVVTAVAGHCELGSALGLGLVLTAVPELPLTWRAALPMIGARALTVVVGGVIVSMVESFPVLLAAVTVAATVFGAFVPMVGSTAGLTVVLIAIDLSAPGELVALWPYATGAAVVVVAWAAWFGMARRMGRHRDEPEEVAGLRRGASGHAVRVAVAVGLAVWLASLLPRDLVGGHWLVTSVLLTVQPSQAQTGMRLVQRLSGNSVGALIAAVLLGFAPPAPVTIVVTVGLFFLAMALRPVNYIWWAITGPPVLLVISEYPELFPWYEGGVRLAMNVAGATIVVLVVFVAPLVAVWWQRMRRSEPTDGP